MSLKHVFTLFFISLFYSNSLTFQDNIFRKSLENNPNKNIMISPYSLYKILSLLSNGSTGNTKKEILELLYPDKEIDDTILEKMNSKIYESNSNIQSEDEIDDSNPKQCSGGDCKVTFKEANAIFMRDSIELQDEFKKICDNYNNSYFELVDVDQVNNFCKEKTEGKIDHIIDQITELTKMLLVNALLFKGTWEKKFDGVYTNKQDFLNSDNTTVKVDTMFQFFEQTMYFEDEKAQIISLPYISNKLETKMIIIKPNLAKYSSALDFLDKEKIIFSEIESKLEYTENVNLYLPKFIYESNFDIKKVLKDLGMISAFDSSKATLDYILKGSYVGQFLHKTFIDLNENGTEASASTVAEIKLNGTRSDKEYHMHINNSFIFMIQSDKINDIDDNYLMPFIGIVNNLKESNEPDTDNSTTRISNVNETNDTSLDDEPVKIPNYGMNFKINLLLNISLMALLLSL